ncbi:MAG TPA: AAA family ATPase [Chloroflexia bacterium]|nr:AAA family ATPase [Chloroflexia bacterium]
MSAMRATLSSYVPPPVVRQLAADPAPIPTPSAAHVPAAVLFADISGFTPLAERLARQSTAGAEELTAWLNAYFGRLIDQIVAYGGDLVKFAGDALLAIWAADEPLPVLAARAAACGLALPALRAAPGSVSGATPRLRIGIGAGTVALLHLAGVKGRAEFVVAGAPLAEMGAAVHAAQPGEVVLGPAAGRLLAARSTGQPLAAGLFRLQSVVAPPPQHAAPLPPLPASADSALQAYIPRAVLARLLAGQTAWLAELRRVTVLFLHLPALDHAAPDAPARIQAVTQAVQTILYHYEGSMNKIGVDDKGITLIAALGLPPLAHADDATRGVAAAHAIRETLQAQGIASAMGIATGQVFCGEVGNPTRREYTMVGDVVNLAARLMQVADDDILCDAPTYHAARGQIGFAPLPAIMVKGKAGMLAVYRPVGPVGSPAPPPSLPMVGRRREWEVLAGELTALRAGGAGGIVVIEGEAGIGKSRLVTVIQQEATGRGLQVLTGAGDAIEQATAYHAWRSVFRALFAWDALPAALTARRQAVLDALPAADRLRAPLLNVVLPLDLPESALTTHLHGPVRAENIHDLLLRLLHAAAARTPTVVILEDAHWLDSASWALARGAGEPIHRLLLVIATRPPGDPAPADLCRLRDQPGTRWLALAPLVPDEIQALVCRRLGVAALPEPVAAFIQAKAEGHPFYSEEIAYALRDRGLITIQDGICRIPPGAGDLHTVAFPDTVQGVITSRIDRLAPPEQLTLKVASVIGRVFALRTLRAVHPIAADQPHLPAYLARLEQLDLTPLDTPPPDTAYLFKHIITREVAYNLMLFAQRRQLHRALALWYEHPEAADSAAGTGPALAPPYPLLVYHWRAAGDARKTLGYLVKAGANALHTGAAQEAAAIFTEALGLDTAARLGSSPLHRATWERQLGEAYYALGRWQDSRTHLEQAGMLLGQPAPAHTPHLIAAVVRELGRQVLHRIWPARFLGRPPADPTALREAARIWEHLSLTYTSASARLPLVLAGLRTLNLAERAGPSPATARGYATASYVTGILPLPRLAAIYRRLAWRTIRQIADPAALLWVSGAVGTYAAGRGRWAAAERHYRRVLYLAEQLGDHTALSTSLALKAATDALHGAFADATPLLEHLDDLARRRGDLLLLMTSAAWMGFILWRRGDQAAAVGQWERLLEALAAAPPEPNAQSATIYQAQILLYRGEFGRAQAIAEGADAIIGQLPVTVFIPLPTVIAAAEVYLALLAGAAGSSIAQAAALRGLGRSVAALRRFARVFPIARPCTDLYAGHYAWLGGHPAAARTRWRRSLATARALDMPYDMGQAHRAIGQHLPVTHPARAAHLAHAAALFARLGAAADRATSESELV